MEYQQEVLDRGTGQLTTQSMGNWVTVTELGQRFGAGPRKVRAVLHHMGVLAKEGKLYRLPRSWVERGIGIRHDFPRSGRAFDVISPKGQEMITALWSQTSADYEAEAAADSMVVGARDALRMLMATRSAPLGTAGEVRWLLDHFRDIRHDVVARALEVTPALVTRYTKQRADQIAHLQRKLTQPLEELSPIQKLFRMAGLKQDKDSTEYISQAIYTSKK